MCIGMHAFLESSVGLLVCSRVVIAALAACERLAVGPEADALTAVARLAAVLRGSKIEVQSQGQTRSLIDPATASVLSRAFRQIGEPSSTGKLTEMANEVVEISSQLEKLQTRKPPAEELEHLLLFCLAVSRQATASEPSRYARHEHPLRRTLT